MVKLFGRKFLLTTLGLAVVLVLGLWGRPEVGSAAVGAVGIMVAAFSGANAYIDGKHAAPPA